jgi:4-hydroxy-tetrahydrodipicolinate reductase
MLPAGGRVMSQAKRRYRVVQWATGNIGTKALSGLITHPQMELVGLFVYAPSKVGRDAGDICGLAPTGVIATNRIEDILAARPDCVVYTPQLLDLDAVCRLLEAGVNIVTTRFEFIYPPKMDPAVRERVEAACRRGGASIHSTGATPGFATDALPIVLTSLERRLDCLVIEEFADLTSRNSPELLFQFMGFGKPAGEPADREEVAVRDGYRQTMHLLADAIGLPLDGFAASEDEAVTPEDLVIAAGKVAAGTVGAKRMTISGLRQGKPLIVVRTNWYLTRKVAVDWDLRETGWRLQVLGDAPLDVSVTFPIPDDDFPKVIPGVSAHRPVNAVPAVCEAAPGIRTVLDLPQVVATFG